LPDFGRLPNFVCFGGKSGHQTGALQIYGGDFFAVTRSEWDAETLSEQRAQTDRTVRLFEEANIAARA
jgi:hypothetical protein